MVQPPSPFRYFNQARLNSKRMVGRRPHLSRLELSVISCFGAVQGTAVYLAQAAVAEGFDEVKNYLPIMHETLAPLHTFLISLAIAPSYGAYTWPNSELRAAADSLAELGISMKYHQTTIADGSNGSNGRVAFSPQSSQLPAVGAAVEQLARGMREFASEAYFFGEDLTLAFNEGWRRLTHAEDIFNELFTQAISAKAFGMAYKPQSDELLSLVMNYRQTNHRPFSGRKK